jgi:hypothetical protein
MRNSGKHNHIFSLNQLIYSSSQLHFSTMYGHQAGQKKKISTHIYLGLRFQCITYVLYMYRHQVRWYSWGRGLLWAPWSVVDPSGCKKLSSPYSPRPAHLFSLQWVLGLFPGCGVDRSC